ncbi:MAG: EAL domain-containing protein [Suipraeoptans sp.]
MDYWLMMGASMGKRITDYFSNSLVIRSIHRGLTLAIPFLIMGSFALLLNNFPLESYQIFIKETFLNGIISTFFVTLYNVTLGSLTFIIILTISISFGQIITSKLYFLYPLIALLSYIAFCGGMDDPDINIFDATWIFTAMVITMVSSAIFRTCEKHIDNNRKNNKGIKFYSMGAGYYFNLALAYIAPLVIIVSLFAMIGMALRLSTGNANITNFGSLIFLKLFEKMGRSLFSVLLYVVVVHLLWFFGIHGTNTLEAVAIDYFKPGIEINQQLIESGQAPTEIFSRVFLDSFIFIGGCGCALALTIAIIISSRKKHTRRLGLFSLPTVLFNISEIPIFGFPVVFSTNMFIPFLITPVIITLTSYVAMNTGLVPMPINEVGWTVPIIISGYQATGSIAGGILQLFNLLIGILIYMPFVRISEHSQVTKYRNIVKQIELDAFDAEEKGTGLLLLSDSYKYNYYAKTLAEDLRTALANQEPVLFYQPQITNTDTLHGVEGLLRWQHPSFGYIAPPVLIMLASESGFLDELTYYLMERSIDDGTKMVKKMNREVHISINISPKHMESEEFLERTRKYTSDAKKNGIQPVLEFTERTVMSAGEEQLEKIKKLQSEGNEFSIDDFGMGNSSILRLQENSFDEVKLDGSLVKQLTQNERSKEIISSIVKLSKSLNFRIVAEYVETKEHRDRLEEIGCYIYQGYYFSRALPIDQLLDYLSVFTTRSK